MSRISDNVEISVSYYPSKKQPQSVVAILGENGENISGEGAEKTIFGAGTQYEAEKSVAFPVQR